MDIVDDLVSELRYAGTYGYMPARTRQAVEQAAAEIERLRAELEARDGQIAAWLREEAGLISQETASHCTMITTLRNAATAIASGSYRKDEA